MEEEQKQPGEDSAMDEEKEEEQEQAKAIPAPVKREALTRMSSASERILSIIAALKKMETTDEKQDSPTPAPIAGAIQATHDELMSLFEKKAAIEGKTLDEIAKESASDSETTKASMPGPVRDKLLTVLTSVSERLLSAMKWMKEQPEGPGEIPDSFKKGIKMLTADLGSLIEKYPSPTSKEVEEPKSETPDADVSKAADPQRARDILYAAIQQIDRGELEGDEFKQAVARILEALKGCSSEEEEKKEVQKRGSKMAAGRLARLRNVHSGLRDLTKLLDPVITEMGSLVKELENSPVEKDEEMDTTVEKGSEQEKEDPIAKAIADALKPLVEQIGTISKKLEEQQSSIEKLSNERAIAKSGAPDKTQGQKVDDGSSKEPKSNFTGLMPEQLRGRFNHGRKIED